MKKIILFLLMLSIAFSVDLERIGTHTVDENFTNTVNYVDYFYGDYANFTEKMIESYQSELDYIKMRAGPVIVSRWSITSTDSVLMINVTGIYPGFVTKENDLYRIGGKGFIDNLCTEYPYSTVSKIDQRFSFVTVLPESLAVISVPDNGSEDLSSVFYELSVSAYGNYVYRDMRFTVKNDTDIHTYCDERAGVDALLKQGITAVEGSNEISRDSFIPVLAMLALLIFSLAYLVKK